jgi:UDP-2,3-diacylglucosamine pyrophosphatase LpxH
VGHELTRILSDVHFGDRACRVRSFSQLRPCLDGAGSLVFNGDTLDTRPGKHPERTALLRGEVLDFAASAGPAVTFLSGNHDPDISGQHALEFAGGLILVTHGDVLFDSIVPWSKDAPVIRSRLTAALAALPGDEAASLEGQLRAFRSVSASVPQLHQSETNPLRYAVRVAGDTVWPPYRALAILRAWREAPARAAALARRHRPKARFIIIGHTHRPGVWRTHSGVIVINTGCFSRPFEAMAAEISPGGICVRRVERRGGAFHPGRPVAEFPLP